MKRPMTEEELTRAVHRSKTVNYSVLALLLLLAAALLSALLLFRARHTFTPAKWRSAPDRRAELVDDLLRTHDLTGMTEAQVLALLGPHDNGLSGQGDRLVYYLGPEPGLLSIDSAWLVLDLTDGAVSACSLTTD